ncbi:tetratricopeptide repeat protein [Salipaludibacillus daqingensis]|uniref:tetratricopeptide repeat protein n=1 Tax=Salipaludibacillus daqingensis TaxID=3041001 RepID=UPI002474F4CA|nr:tetratricopeptide repeat protein [Salipaludibacillus daqingensis]
MKGYKILMLGTFQCFYKNEPFNKVPTGKVQLLLAYLFLHADLPLNRKQLAFKFWPDTTEQQALTNLRKLIFHIKKIVPHADNHLGLNNGYIIWHSLNQLDIDVFHFESLTSSHRVTDLIQAVNYYHGDFLPGLEEEWVEERRDTLKLRYTNALQKLMNIHEMNRDFDQALLFAFRLLYLDTLSESFHLNIIRLHILKGDIEKAKKQFNNLKKVLRSELDLEPSSDTITIYDQLISQHSNRVPFDKQYIPMIGRKKEWQFLIESWEKAKENNSLLTLVKGEAGIGKSRLLEEFSVWALSQGIPLISIQCFAMDEGVPYEPFISYLEKENMDTLDQDHLVDLSRMMPIIKQRYPTLKKPTELQENWSLRSWYHAADHALFKDKSAILILDNIQWIDKESLNLIEALMCKKRLNPLLIITTLRLNEKKHTDLDQVIDKLNMNQKVRSIQVAPFTKSETERLVKIFHKQPKISTSRIHKYSDGNPLFIQEIIKHTDEDESRNELNATILTMMRQRLDKLPLEQLELCNYLSVIGKPISLSFLSNLNDNKDKTLHLLMDLLKRRILKKNKNDRIDFYHDRMREAADLKISDSTTLLIHAKVAKVMVESSSNSIASSEIAFHFEKGGYEKEAIPYYIQALMEAKDMYAHDKVITYCHKLLRFIPLEKQTDTLSMLANAYRMSGKWREAEKAYRKWLDQFSSFVSLEQKGRHEVQLAECLRLQGKYQDTLELLHQSLYIFETLSEMRGLVEVTGNLGMVYQYLGDDNKALDYLQRSINLAKGTEQEGKYTGILGNLYFEKGQYPEAMVLFNETIRLANKHDHRSSLAKAFAGKGLTYIEMEELHLAFQSINERVQVSRALKERMGIATSLGLLGKVYMKAGYLQEAKTCLTHNLQEALIIGDKRTVAITLGLLGHTIGKLKEMDLALWMLTHSINIAKSLNIPFFLCDNLYYLGYLYVKNTDRGNAHMYLKQSLELAVKYKRHQRICSIQRLMIQIDWEHKKINSSFAILRLNELFTNSISLREQIYIHYLIVRIGGINENIREINESREKAHSILKTLFHQSSFPFYKQWESKFGFTLKGEVIKAPKIPKEGKVPILPVSKLKELIKRI